MCFKMKSFMSSEAVQKPLVFQSRGLKMPITTIEFVFLFLGEISLLLTLDFRECPLQGETIIVLY